MLATIALLASLAIAATAPPRPTITVSAPPAVPRVGATWNATVRARGARPSAVFVESNGNRSLATLRRAGTAFRARVTFDRSGRSRYGVVVSGRRRYVGRLTVRPPLLQQPFGVVPEPSGTILVADWRASAVYRLDPARHAGSLAARVEAPRDLRRGRDGKLLVSSGPTIVHLDPSTGATRTLAGAGAAVEGIAESADGTLYASTQSSIVAIAPNGSRSTFASGLDGVHGILLTDRGLVACESFAGRVLRISGGSVATLASGLANPSYAVPGPEGSLYVTEFAGNRVSRIDASGRIERVAEVPQPAPLTLEPDGRLLVGSLTGALYRVDAVAHTATAIYP
jgi:virginiamycin B lyase